MEILNVLYQSVFAPLGVFNKNYAKGKLGASVAVVFTTIILGSVIGPVGYYYANRNQYEISLDINGMLIGVGGSIFTWLAACLMFWGLSKAFKKDISFQQMTSTWGLSYIPNFLCVILYYLLMVVPGANYVSGFAAFIIITLFIMFLVWKAIFYFMLMRFVIDTTLNEIMISTTVAAVVFSILMMVGFRVGIEVPML